MFVWTASGHSAKIWLKQLKDSLLDFIDTPTIYTLTLLIRT